MRRIEEGIRDLPKDFEEDHLEVIFNPKNRGSLRAYANARLNAMIFLRQGFPAQPWSESKKFISQLTVLRQKLELLERNWNALANDTNDFECPALDKVDLQDHEFYALQIDPALHQCLK